VSVPLEHTGHIDEIVVAEDAESVVVLAIVCTPAMPGIGLHHDEPHRVWLAEPLGDRQVIDGATGRTLRNEQRRGED
jgi:hypothetical protein